MGQFALLSDDGSRIFFRKFDLKVVNVCAIACLKSATMLVLCSNVSCYSRHEKVYMHSRVQCALNGHLNSHVNIVVIINIII